MNFLAPFVGGGDLFGMGAGNLEDMGITAEDLGIEENEHEKKQREKAKAQQKEIPKEDSKKEPSFDENVVLMSSKDGLNSFFLLIFGKNSY